MDIKICNCCKQEKPIEAFSLLVSSKDGHKEYCKECASKRGRIYREKHSDEIKARAKEAYWKSKEKREERTREQMLSTPYKTCSFCGTEKPISDFYRCGNGGFRSYCKKCANKKSRAYMEANRDAVIARKRQYHKDHKAEIDAYNHQYYKEHSEEAKERTKKWVQDNHERAMENGLMHFHRNRARKAGVASTFTKQEWEWCKESFSVDGITRCAYCGKPIKRAFRDHVVSISQGGEDVASNIVPSCNSCNASKGIKPLEEWYPTYKHYSKERQDKIEAYLEEIRQANTERAI